PPIIEEAKPAPDVSHPLIKKETELKESQAAEPAVSVSPQPVVAVKPKVKPPVEKEPAKSAVPRTSKSPLGDTIRIQISRLDNLIKLISEIVLDRSKMDYRIKDAGNIFLTVKTLQDNFKSLSVDGDEDMVRSDGFEDINSMLNDLYDQSGKLSSNFKEDFYKSQSFVDQIKDEILNLRMIPISTLFTTYPRAVRRLANEFGKRITLEIEGENTELDKKMIEDLNDPLVHLIRNAIDHGIEEPDNRTALGKSEEGRIKLSARQGRGTIIIEIEDDGRGINVDKIKESAIRKGLVSPEEVNEYSRERLLEFLFMPGFSTSRIITDISGRGVGLDVVKKNVEDKLKGTVLIQSRPNEGSKFVINLPITLATTQALLVKVGERTYAIPYSYVEETAAHSPKEIIKVVDRTAINIRDQILPLVILGKVLDIPDFKEIVDEVMTTIILHSGQERMVFVVDEIIDEQEIVVKPLGKFMQKVSNVSGVTILGDGEIVIILHVPDLIHTARVMAESVPSHLRKMKRKVEKQRILVVDDSLNTREVEKNILEAHDYEVEVAIDGEEAFEIAQKQEFDLVVTDVEMPRVNGFELTKMLRDDDRYKNTPIIIVTSRDKDEDRRRGIEIGADAYIVKSAFDESNLIDTIETLIGPLK
ncbi:response regulator, partial [candidate division CSSED10-310 bacterium]